jgi:hypothetical protein
MHILIWVHECQGPFLSLARVKLPLHNYTYFTVTEDSHQLNVTKNVVQYNLDYPW